MNTGSLSRDEWQLFTRMPNGPYVDEPQEGDVQKPHWVSLQVWDSIGDLELLSVFSGLRQSVAEQSEQWREYFNVRARSFQSSRYSQLPKTLLTPPPTPHFILGSRKGVLSGGRG